MACPVEQLDGKGTGSAVPVPSADQGEARMSSMPRRTFSPEFKLQIVSQIQSGEKRLAQLCREHAICETVVRRWVQQHQEQGENAWRSPAAPVERTLQARIAELEASLGRAHLENELLRRALEKGGLPSTRNGR
jgi:transposase